MKYRKLGNSELLVSEIGFGSWLTFTDNAAAAGAHVDPALFTEAERLLPSH